MGHQIFPPKKPKKPKPPKCASSIKNTNAENFEKTLQVLQEFSAEFLKDLKTTKESIIILTNEVTRLIQTINNR